MTALLAVGLAIGVAACGSSSSSPTASTTARYQARLTLAKCIRAHGINVPDPSPTASAAGGGGAFRVLRNYPLSEIRSVFEACRKDVPQAFPALNLSSAQRAQFEHQLVLFAECMRSHGVDIPDPTFNGGGAFGFAQAFRSQDLNSPQFRSALTACRSLRPRFRRTGA